MSIKSIRELCIFMTDDHLRQVNNCFEKFEELNDDKRRLARQMQRLKKSLNSAVFANCISHATAGVAVAKNSAVPTSQEAELSTQMEGVNGECLRLAHRISQIGTFDTCKLTKHLASVLTKRTGTAWLPVRYLLRAETIRRPRIDAYAVIKAESAKLLPGIFDTMMILDKDTDLPVLDSWVKFRESECGSSLVDVPEYELIENMDNVWMFTSNDFISVGVSDRFNAFFNFNGVDTKPFLHLCVSEEYQDSLRAVGKLNNVPCYRDYSNPDLPTNHPRDIALSALSELVTARYVQSELHSAHDSTASHCPKPCQMGE